MDGIKGLSNKLLASVREVLKTNQHLPRNEDLLKIASIEEMNKHQTDEKLVGNQHRIDADENGKINRHDFKLLLGAKHPRGKKKPPSMVDEAGQHEALSLGVLAAKHFDHHLNATQGGNFDLSDSQMASHAKKADAVRAKIEHHFGSKVAHDVAAHSETAADYEEGTIGGGNSHPVFAKKYLGGVEHKKYNDQIDKQDLKMHGDTGVTTHHLP